MVTSIDLKKNLLVTCGMVRRGFDEYARLVPDNLIKVFDVRTLRPLNTSLRFGPGAFKVKFLPRFSSTFAVVSRGGHLQLMEAEAHLAEVNFYQVQTGGAVSCMEVSSSGESMVFGDSEGLLHQWADRQDMHLNSYSEPTPFVELQQPLPFPVEMHDSLAKVIPHFSESMPLSHWDPQLLIRKPNIVPCLDSRLIPDLKWTDFIGAAPNPGAGFKRNHQPSIDKFCDKSIKDKKKPGVQTRRVFEFLSSPLRRKMQVPRPYARVNIKIPKMGLASFDFSAFNKTRFTGLDNLLPNAYCNSILQVLYFIPALRAHMTNHLCEKESCLTCELGFLFHMLQHSRTGTAEPRNLLRVLRQIPEATALGLLDPVEASSELMLAVKIQDFVRFVLEALNKEALETRDLIEGKGTHGMHNKPTMIEAVFGSRISKQLHCLGGNHDAVSQESLQFSLKLKYPHTAKMIPFTELVSNSMRDEASFRVWCETCGKYQPTRTVKSVRSLPNVLVINCNVNTDQELHLWRNGKNDSTVGNNASPNNLMSQFNSTNVEGVSAHKNTNKDSPKAGFNHDYQPASYPGHTDKTENATPDPDAAWLPPLLKIELPKDPNGHPAVRRIKPVAKETDVHPKNKEENELRRQRIVEGNAPKVGKVWNLPVNPSTQSALYRLTSVTSHVADPPEANSALNTVNGEHLVVHVRAGLEYSMPLTSSQDSGPTKRKALRSDDNWYLFNDFVINPSSGDNCVDFQPIWKQPCVLTYTRVDMNDILPPEPTRLPLKDSDVLTRPQVSLARVPAILRSFRPLEPGEKIQLVAIDCEFVAVEREEVEQGRDGAVRVVKPTRLSLARVTVIRADGPHLGTTFIDDYILTSEAVVDYLTRFSGLKPGDLDPSVSPHHLVTLKTAYIKLRALCDRGIIFIGHGLKKDFQMINIVVPRRQIIDTVELFYLPKQRRLGLRFLAAHLLGADIQTDTHDSIEDARTALSLWQRYEQVKQDGALAQLLADLYNAGRRTGFKIKKVS